MTFLLASFIHYSNLGTIIFLSLVKLFPAITRPCIGLLCWLDSSMGLCFYTIFIRLWFGQSFPRFHLVLSFGRMYLVSFFLLRKAYGRYILASKDFIRACLSTSLWIILNEYTKIKDSHTIYLKMHYIYI